MPFDKFDRQHGPALAQVANRGWLCAGMVGPRGMYVVNFDTILYFRYALARVKGKRTTFLFKFDAASLRALEKAAQKFTDVFVGLICSRLDLVCPLSMQQFRLLRDARVQAEGKRPARAFDLLVDASRGRQFHVLVRDPRRRGKYLRDVAVPRSAFPRCLFR